MWRVVCLGLLLCSGCTKFDHPVVAEQRATLDPRLLGNWVFENDEGRYELAVRADGRVGVVAGTSLKPGEPPEADEVRFVTTRVGRRDYGSAQGGDSPRDGWNLFHYEIKRGQLEISFVEDDVWKNAVERGELPGTIEKSWKVLARVSATPEQLHAWLKKHPNAFTSDKDERFIFRRPLAN